MKLKLREKRTQIYGATSNSHYLLHSSNVYMLLPHVKLQDCVEVIIVAILIQSIYKTYYNKIKMPTVKRVISDNEQCLWRQSGAVFLSNLKIRVYHLSFLMQGVIRIEWKKFNTFVR